MVHPQRETVLSIVNSGHHVLVHVQSKESIAAVGDSGFRQRIIKDDDGLVIQYERDGEVVKRDRITPSEIPHVEFYDWTVDKQF